MNEVTCPFCKPSDVLAETDCFYIIKDRFPVNPGHTLVILKRHEPSAFGVTRAEWADLYEAIRSAKEFIEAGFGADEFNIGVNVGESAGQTIPHVHIHIIPRYPGDCESPHGGVRLVKPALVDY